MIKRIKVLAFPLLILFTIAMQFSLVSKVGAEPAHCFMGSLVGDAPTHSVDCSTLAPFIQNQFQTAPLDDKCYITFDGWTVQSKPYSSAPYDPKDTSESCQKWLYVANESANAVPKCAAVDGSYSDWQAGKITDLSKYNVNAKCTDYYGKLTTNNGGDQNYFTNGKCFIIFKTSDPGKFDSTFYECKNGLQALVSHQQPTPTPAGQLNTVSRKDVANCGANGETVEQCYNKNPIVNLLDIAVNFLAAGVGVVVVIMVIIGGIQYTSAGNNPQTVAAARKKISNALIAFVAFLLVYAFMQWLIPGGIF